jgi:hypothetical protein
MSRHRPDPAERVQLTFDCPFCDSLEGQWCITSGGLYSQLLHADRFYLAKGAGLLPVLEEVP